MTDYHSLQVWQKAHKFTQEIYRFTKDLPSDEKFGLISQLKRASSSIPINLAEGCGRGTPGELEHFASISFGSAAEVEYELELTYALGFVSEGKYQQLISQVREIKMMLTGLIKKVHSNR